jgi:hypothetical protein
MSLKPEEFGSSFKGFLDQMAAQAPAQEPVFLRRLRDHFGQAPGALPVIAESFETHDHPNLQVAIDDFLSRAGCSAEVVGVAGGQQFMRLSLADLVAPRGSALLGGASPSEGPVEYVNISLDGERMQTCVQSGLFLIRDGDGRLAMLVRGKSEFSHLEKGLHVDVMACEKSAAERFLATLRTSMRQRNVYRGHTLSLSQEKMIGSLVIKYHPLPRIARERIILPEGLLERIERQTIRFGEHSARLQAAGRHLKRGLLLHGPPGTGKTLTAMYLVAAMRERTVLLLTGRGLGLIEQSCALARALQPSIMILEDVDLVAEERTHKGAGCGPLLFELLNQMDGLADDADVLFLLTTNRPELLEPALAARPGRIDQAIEVPLPDAICRRRLFDLYGQGLTQRLADRERFVQRTEGASAAFIRELMRKAALFAADEGSEIIVEDRHLDEALRELVVQGGELTKSLLGFKLGFRSGSAPTSGRTVSGE